MIIFERRMSEDTSRLKTLVLRHITFKNTRLKTVYVLKVYISTFKTSLTFSKNVLLIYTKYRFVLISATRFMFFNLQKKTDVTEIIINENIRREMKIINLNSMKNTFMISLRII